MKKEPTNVVWTDHDAIVVLCYNAFLVLPWFLSLLLGVGSQESFEEISKNGTLLPIGFWVFSIVPILLALGLIYNRKKQSGCSIKELLGIPSPNKLFVVIQRGFVAGLIFFFVGLFVLGLWSALLTKFGIEAKPQYLIEVLRSGLIPKWQIVGIGLLVTLSAPFVEEIFYRCILFNRLKVGRSKLYAVLLSSGFFAVVHLNLHSLLGVFLAGICFSLVYDSFLPESKTKIEDCEKVGLVGSMVAHFTFNILNFLMTLSFIVQ